jgi:hypothetical protein
MREDTEKQLIPNLLPWNLLDLLHAIRFGRSYFEQEIIDKAISLCKKRERNENNARNEEAHE